MNSDVKAILLAFAVIGSFAGGAFTAVKLSPQGGCKCEVQHKHGEKIGSPVGSQK